MRDELLAYLLNDLDDQQRERIEARLDGDPIWQHELQRLRALVEAQDPDAADTDSVPVDLVDRTCSFVKQASSQGALSPAVLPASLSESCEIAPPKSKRWSLLDMAVVASILLALGTLLVPALRSSRDAARRSQCQEKLHQLGSALNRFAWQSEGQLPAIDRHENAGSFSLQLVESGIITREQLVELLVCPSTQLAEDIFSGKVVLRLPTRRELRIANGEELLSLLETMGGSFAYRIGYFDEQGNFHQIEFSGSSNEPIMADKPSFNVVGFQSDHHKNCGQNVLFQDQSVRYVLICLQNENDEHWFLNADGEHAAGKSEYDIVMARSEAGPSGLKWSKSLDSTKSPQFSEK